MRDGSARSVGALALNEGAGAVGLQITYFAIPLAAVQVFHVGPLAIGALNLLESVAALLFGLVAGRLIDEAGGFRSVVVADLARFCLLALLGFAFLTQPQLWMLYAAMLLLGMASLTHEAGLTTAVLMLRTRSPRRLNKVNAVLRVSSVVAELSGPGLGGLVVAVLGFGAAMLTGSLWFFLAVLACTGATAVMKRDRSPLGSRAGSSSREEGDRADDSTAAGAAEGFRFIWKDDVLRNLSLSSLHFNLFSAAFQAVILIYCVRELGMETWGLALVGICSGVGALVGAGLAATEFVASHQKTTYAIALVIPGAAVLAMVSAGTLSTGGATVVVATGQALFSASMVVCLVSFNTVRQIRSPERIAGRIAASERVLALGGEIPGALIGGVGGTMFALQVPLVVAAIGMMAAAAWLARVPDWSVDAPQSQLDGDVGASQH